MNGGPSHRRTGGDGPRLLDAPRLHFRHAHEFFQPGLLARLQHLRIERVEDGRRLGVVVTVEGIHADIESPAGRQHILVILFAVDVAQDGLGLQLDAVIAAQRFLGQPAGDLGMAAAQLQPSLDEHFGADSRRRAGREACIRCRRLTRRRLLVSDRHRRHGGRSALDLRQRLPRRAELGIDAERVETEADGQLPGLRQARLGLAHAVGIAAGRGHEVIRFRDECVDFPARQQIELDQRLLRTVVVGTKDGAQALAFQRLLPSLDQLAVALKLAYIGH